jgi:hypothetical protein
MVVVVGLAWIVAQSATGCHGREAKASVVPLSARVERPGDAPVVIRDIVALQRSPRWRDRDRAAIALRRVDWRRHPEVVGALAFSMLHDPEEEVREEAAESLTRMRPCLPEAREALRQAANDRDSTTRKWARRGLAALSKECAVPCDHCQDASPVLEPPGTVLSEVPRVIEPLNAPPPPPVPFAAPGGEPAFRPIPDSIESNVPAPGDLEPLPPPSSGDVRRLPTHSRIEAPRLAARRGLFRAWPGR